jgi:glycosyltransferase involved in cell wall biosynthesis
MTSLRLAIIADYLEEGWHSMDLCAEKLHEYLQLEHSHQIEVTIIRPSFNWRFFKIRKQKNLVKLDRFINRFMDYPIYLKSIAKDYDFFHIADHSYAHLAHYLPPQKTGVFCHDLDAFRSVINPELEPRPIWYKFMSKHILSGLSKAKFIFYTTSEIAKQIKTFQIAPKSETKQALLGISSEFSTSKIFTENLIQYPYLLHVGSCVPRKRIDVLLKIFAKILPIYPNLKLVKVGISWLPEHIQLIAEHELQNSIVEMSNLEREKIAHLYQQAQLVLLTSEFEGFGLPVIEALACGATVLVSDIPVLREVGRTAVICCSVGDIDMWVNTIVELLETPQKAPSLEVKLEQASKYSWSNHAEVIANAYLDLASKNH